jgi:hypothetical protein
MGIKENIKKVKKETKATLNKPEVKESWQKLRSGFPIKGWEWPFFIWGWVTGLFSPLFWIIMVTLYLINDRWEHPINSKLHRRVLWWGVVMGVLAVIAVILALLGIIE